MFDPDKHTPVPNRRLIYLGACLIVGIRFARERQVHVRVVPTQNAVKESIALATEVFERRSIKQLIVAQCVRRYQDPEL